MLTIHSEPSSKHSPPRASTSPSPPTALCYQTEVFTASHSPIAASSESSVASVFSPGSSGHSKGGKDAREKAGAVVGGDTPEADGVKLLLHLLFSSFVPFLAASLSTSRSLSRLCLPSHQYNVALTILAGIHLTTSSAFKETAYSTSTYIIRVPPFLLDLLRASGPLYIGQFRHRDTDILPQTCTHHRRLILWVVFSLNTCSPGSQRARRDPTAVTLLASRSPRAVHPLTPLDPYPYSSKTVLKCASRRLSGRQAEGWTGVLE
ncbi:hypothetical protein DFH08DRAFT_950985 [Mycena albidolilacea]|uniref:Uncharacterized protein n=1 Tax=Mycena albidolilacea TaxID=1033008 RepID=A0AAD7AM64_9AGAR|nr:hypothetical protein DFH08DRAFT_950985 [Mycena albidolilacea]